MNWRRIIVDGVEWKYHIGSGSAEARSGARKLSGTLSEISGGTSFSIERGRHKQSSDGMITPKQVAAWITRRTS